MPNSAHPIPAFLHANFHKNADEKPATTSSSLFKGLDDVTKEIPKGFEPGNYFKFQPISNDFLSHMCGLHGGVCEIGGRVL